MSSRSRKIRFSPLSWLLLISLICLIPPRLTRPADTWLYEHLARLGGSGSEATLQLRLDSSEPVETRTETQEHHYVTCPTVGTLLLDDETVHETFAALPLGPRDLAVIAAKLSDRGVTALAISSPLTWSDETADITRNILSEVLRRFKAATLGLRGRTAAQADFTPLVLRDFAIPPDRISGDPSGLPSANRPLPNGLAETPDGINADWAPDWIEDEPLTQDPSSDPDLSFPLLMRWNGETMPTLPLRVALRAHGLTPADIRVDLGKNIRIGSRIIPLDDNGRIKLVHAGITPLRLTDLVSTGAPADKDARPSADELFPHAVVIERPTDGRKINSRLDRMGRTLSELLGTLHTEKSSRQVPAHSAVLEYSPFLPTSVWGILLALAALLLALIVLRPLPRWIKGVILLVLLGILISAARSGLAAHQWFKLSAMLLCWLMLIPALSRRRRRRNGSFRS